MCEMLLSFVKKNFKIFYVHVDWLVKLILMAGTQFRVGSKNVFLETQHDKNQGRLIKCNARKENAGG